MNRCVFVSSLADDRSHNEDQPLGPRARQTLGAHRLAVEASRSVIYYATLFRALFKDVPGATSGVSVNVQAKSSVGGTGGVRIQFRLWLISI